MFSRVQAYRRRAALRAVPVPPVAPHGLRGPQKRAQLTAMLQAARPAPATVLADVVSTSLFALVGAFQDEAAALLPANPVHGTLKDQKDAIVWFKG